MYVFDERRPGAGLVRSDRADGSFAFRNLDVFRNRFRLLAIGSDSYKGLNFRLTTGTQVRTRFTPLTLELPLFSGVRLDAATAKNRFTGTLQPRVRELPERPLCANLAVQRPGARRTS